jgi:hypothetical protein
MKNIWDTTVHYSSYPLKIKKLYKNIYIKNAKKYNTWIDCVSKENIKNLYWWFSTPASRDEFQSNIYKFLCIYKVLNHQNSLIHCVILDSETQRKILEEKFSKIKFSVKKKYFYKQISFIRTIVFFLIQFTFVKLVFFFKKKIYSSTNILFDTFVLNWKKNYNLYPGLKKKINYKNLRIVPTFTNLSLKHFFFYVITRYKNNNIIFKENFLLFRDLIQFFFFKFSDTKIIFNKFYEIDLTDIIYEELNENKYLRSVVQAYLNFFFFKRLSYKNIKLTKVINSFENQIVDKGWNLGVNTYYPCIDNIGYNISSHHPQFHYIYPTISEYKANVLPKKIYVTGRKFIQERKKFCKNLDISLVKNFRFLNSNKDNFFINNKDIKVLILLSGIKTHDNYLINLIKDNYDFFLDNKIRVAFKFHPILNSLYLFKEINNYKFFYEVKGNGSEIINRSKIVITTSFTAGLYESLIKKCFTLLCNLHPIDYKLYKSLNFSKKNFFYFENSTQLRMIISKVINKEIYLNKYTEKRVLSFKKDFFY